MTCSDIIQYRQDYLCESSSKTCEIIFITNIINNGFIITNNDTNNINSKIFKQKFEF